MGVDRLLIAPKKSYFGQTFAISTKHFRGSPSSKTCGNIWTYIPRNRCVLLHWYERKDAGRVSHWPPVFTLQNQSGFPRQTRWGWSRNHLQHFREGVSIFLCVSLTFDPNVPLDHPTQNSTSVLAIFELYGLHVCS